MSEEKRIETVNTDKEYRRIVLRVISYFLPYLNPQPQFFHPTLISIVREETDDNHDQRSPGYYNQVINYTALVNEQML
ncbi:MAG: hypothetical protein KA116_04765 [Proteobacteria bacterium]|nr:hypothetical protein [Pseudomonadota bacterium]